MSAPYYRCQCGCMEAWGSMPPACETCPECKSTLAIPGKQFLPGVQHSYVALWVETWEDSEYLPVCIHCSRTRSNIEQLQPVGERFSVCRSDAIEEDLTRAQQSAG